MQVAYFIEVRNMLSLRSNDEIWEFQQRENLRDATRSFVFFTDNFSIGIFISIQYTVFPSFQINFDWEFFSCTLSW